MLYYNILTPNPFHELLVYASEEKIPLGSQVYVPYGKKKVYGLVWGLLDAPEIAEEKIKHVAAVSYPALVGEDWIQWLERMSMYYHVPVVMFVMQTAPKCLWEALEPCAEWYTQFFQVDEYVHPVAGGILLQSRLARSAALSKKKPSAQTQPFFLPPPFAIRPSQRAVSDAIALDAFNVYVVQGPTGSGKTEVYLDRLCALARSKPVLLMMPEITLTRSMLERLTLRLGSPPWVYHSQMTPALRRKHFIAASDNTPGLWIGTRSCIFLPQKWAMIVIDEEHDASYVQSQKQYYSAKQMLIMRAKMLNIPIVLGSATPSLDSVYHAQKGQYTLLHLEKSYHAPIQPIIIDAKTQVMHKGLVMPIWHAMDEQLRLGHHVLIFLNRRGYAPVLMCTTCGWKSVCPRCDAALVVHALQKELRCHYCDWREKIPQHCPEHHATLKEMGVGTQRLEETLKARYADVPMQRMDLDSPLKERMAFESFLLHKGPAIILGTQMISKGIDAPFVRMVIVVTIDGALMRSEFKADERVYQLLSQVMGRAARRERSLNDAPDTVWIQTYIPEHPLFEAVRQGSLAQYSEVLLSWRYKQQLPPFTYVCLFRLEHPQEHMLKELSIRLRSEAVYRSKNWRVFGPFPSWMRRRKDQYHYTGMIVSPTRRTLDEAMEALIAVLKKTKVQWRLERDAQDAQA